MANIPTAIAIGQEYLPNTHLNLSLQHFLADEYLGM